MAEPTTIVTLLELRTLVRDLTDSDTPAPERHHIKDTFLNRCINRHGARWWDKLTRAVPSYCTLDHPITAVEYQNDYELPGDVYRLVSLVASDGSQVCEVTPFEVGPEEAMLRQLQLTGGAGSHIGGYKHRVLTKGPGLPKELRIRPAPRTTSHTFYVTYTPPWRALSADDDAIDGFNGWEQWIVYASCVDVATRKNDDTSDHLRMMKDIEADIEQHMTALDLSRPKRVRDTRHADMPAFSDPLARYFWGTHVP